MTTSFKLSYQDLIKKTKLENPTFKELKLRAETLFPDLKGTKYFLQYLDEEDYVLISDDADIDTLISEPSPCYKILISTNLISSPQQLNKEECNTEKMTEASSYDQHDVVVGYPVFGENKSNQETTSHKMEKCIYRKAAWNNSNKKNRLHLNQETKNIIKLAKKIYKKKLDDQKSKDEFLARIEGKSDLIEVKPKSRIILLEAKKMLVPLTKEETEELKALKIKDQEKMSLKRRSAPESESENESKLDVESKRLIKLAKKIYKKKIEDQNSKDDFLAGLAAKSDLAKTKPKKRIIVLQAKKSLVPLSLEEGEELENIDKKLKEKKLKKKEGQKEKKGLIEDFKNYINGSASSPTEIEAKVLSRFEQDPKLFQKKPGFRYHLLKLKMAKKSLNTDEEHEFVTLKAKIESGNKERFAPHGKANIKNMKEEIKKRIQGSKYPGVAYALLKFNNNNNFVMNAQIKHKLDELILSEPDAFSKLPQVRKAFLRYKKNVTNLTQEEEAELSMPLRKVKENNNPEQFNTLVEKKVARQLNQMIPNIVSQVKDKIIGESQLNLNAHSTSSNCSAKGISDDFKGRLVTMMNSYPEKPTYNCKEVFFTVMVKNIGKSNWNKCFIGTNEYQLSPLPDLKTGDESIVTFSVKNTQLPNFSVDVNFFREKQKIGEAFQVKIINIVPDQKNQQGNLAELQKKADQIISILGSNRQKTLEYLQKNNNSSIEELIDRLVTNPEELKKIQQ